MNAKPEETVRRFIELRAQGLTFARLADELQVAHGTLINWSRKYYREIQNLHELHREALREKCRLTRTATLEQLSEDLRRVREELASRKLSDIPTARLLNLAATLRAETDAAAHPLRFREKITGSDQDPNDFVDPVVEWEG